MTKSGRTTEMGLLQYPWLLKNCRLACPRDRNPQAEWELKTKILDDIAAGLHSIHTCDVVHNDVKCSNILLFSSPSEQREVVAKISDFGCSILLAGTQPTRKAAATTRFASPESYSPQ